MKNLIALILNSKFISRIMDLFIGKYVTIFMVHRAQSKDGSYIGLSPEQLEEYLVYSKENNFEFISIDELIESVINHKKPLKNQICFTLDDGYEDQVLELVPILLKHNAKPTIFVLADVLDGLLWPWDAKISYLFSSTQQYKKLELNFHQKNFTLDLTSNEARIASRRKIVQFAKTLKKKQILELIDVLCVELNSELPDQAPEKYKATNWDQLRHFEKQGLKVGSHACSHFLFNSLDESEVLKELKRSITRLNEELDSPARVFCYPSGTSNDYSNAHAQMVKDCGYKAAVSANPGNSSFKEINKNLFNISRHGIPQSLHEYARYSSWVEVIRTKLSK
jgi:peptidoglycan/xylan/chitin deacetylase (PgdA/CDA1 family)